MRWDIFCKVIDNHGDAGVCWRLAADLASRGQQVRLWIDDPAPLAWMAPTGAPGVEVQPWTAHAPWPAPGDVVVEAFGCTLDDAFVRRMAAASRPPAWINLEYLTAETFAERQHRLPSPVWHGPGAGLTKHFFYPGFTAGTGGLPREAELPARQAAFDADRWLAQLGIAPRPGERRVALFCYEPAALPALLAQLRQCAQPTRLLVAAGRATQAVQNLVKAEISGEIGHKSAPDIDSSLLISYLPWLPQPEFDGLLWAGELNLVRGEDSLVRAIWAGRPFLWQLYPQDDGAHHTKLAAWLKLLGGPPSLHAAYRAWNGDTAAPLPPLDTAGWQPAFTALRGRLLAQDDLSSQLIRFAAEKG